MTFFDRPDLGRSLTVPLINNGRNSLSGSVDSLQSQSSTYSTCCNPLFVLYCHSHDSTISVAKKKMRNAIDEGCRKLKSRDQVDETVELLHLKYICIYLLKSVVYNSIVCGVNTCICRFIVGLWNTVKRHVLRFDCMRT